MANIVSCNNWKWSRDFQKRNKNKHDFSCLYAFKTKTQSPWESIWGSKAVHKPQILLQQLLFSSIAAQCLFFNSNLHLHHRKWKAWPSPPKLDNTIFRKTACTVCVCVEFFDKDIRHKCTTLATTIFVTLLYSTKGPFSQKLGTLVNKKTAATWSDDITTDRWRRARRTHSALKVRGHLL